MKGCAIYARYSSDLQSPTSIEDQVRLCRAHATAQGWTVVRVFEDHALSGFASESRQGYQELLAAALGPAPPFDVILVEDLGRLTRNTGEALRLYQRLQFKGIEIVGVSDGIQTGQRGAKIHLTIKGLTRETEVAAQALRFRLQLLEVRGPADVDAALAHVRREPADVLYVVPTGAVEAQHQRIITFAMERKLPTVWPASSRFGQAGGLITYSHSAEEMERRTAALVDKILKGAKPADLPVEQPTKFELAINLKTAKALGLTIPPSLLGRADEVIQ